MQQVPLFSFTKSLMALWGNQTTTVHAPPKHCYLLIIYADLSVTFLIFLFFLIVAPRSISQVLGFRNCSKGLNIFSTSFWISLLTTDSLVQWSEKLVGTAFLNQFLSGRKDHVWMNRKFPTESIQLSLFPTPAAIFHHFEILNTEANGEK